jgi:hypothetical protein
MDALDFRQDLTMADPNVALANQLKNIESRTGHTLAQMRALLAGSGLNRHGELRTWLMDRLGLGYGDANTVVTLARQPEVHAADDPLDAIYSGAKAGLRHLHDAAMEAIGRIGPFETSHKKATVSLRRKKQFALLGPATRDQIEIGLNARDLPSHPRLKVMPPGGMCQYTVRIAHAEDVDTTLLAWVRAAYDSAA